LHDEYILLPHYTKCSSELVVPKAYNSARLQVSHSNTASVLSVVEGCDCWA